MLVKLMAYWLRKVMLPLKLEEGYNSELRRTLDDLGHHLMLERQKFLLPELEMQEVTVLGHRMSCCGKFQLVIVLGQNEIAGDSDEPLEGGQKQIKASNAEPFADSGGIVAPPQVFRRLAEVHAPRLRLSLFPYSRLRLVRVI